MKWGLGARIIELEHQEAYERAMSRYRAEKAREQRRKPRGVVGASVAGLVGSVGRKPSRCS
jgi:hypothetical protein